MGNKDLNKEKFTSVILLTDFSKGAKNAISYAVAAFGEDVEYQLVNAYYARTSSATLLDLNDMLAKESKVGLDEEEAWMKKEFSDLNLKIETYSIFGSPVDAIKRLSGDKFHDLVIMGTKGASGIDSVLFGSVASTVIRATVVPVISIPTDYSFNGFNEVVFATDGSTNYKDEAIDAIRKIQLKFKSNVTVFSVEKAGSHTDLSALNLEIENAHYTTVEDDDVVESVTTFCTDKKADLLVILPKHTGFFDRLFHKSVSKELVERANMPILSLEND